MKILLREVSAEIEEKKSRFIAFLSPVKDQAAAEDFIARKKKEYWDARHNCSAFVLGADASVTRCSDDGEPSGTAGRPMLETLLHSEIRNVAVVVTRYFGGTLLGTGGLIRAYTEAVNAAIATANDSKLIAEEIEGYKQEISFDYTLLGKVQHYLAENDIYLVDTIYENDVTVIIQFEKEMLDKISKDITEISSGKANLSTVEESTYLKKSASS